MASIILRSLPGSFPPQGCAECPQNSAKRGYTAADNRAPADQYLPFTGRRQQKLKGSGVPFPVARAELGAWGRVNGLESGRGRFGNGKRRWTLPKAGPEHSNKTRPPSQRRRQTKAPSIDWAPPIARFCQCPNRRPLPALRRRLPVQPPRALRRFS